MDDSEKFPGLEHIEVVPEDVTNPLVYGLQRIEAGMDLEGWDKSPMFLAIEEVLLAEELAIAQLSFKTIPMPVPVYEDPSAHLPLLAMALNVHDAHWGEDPALDDGSLTIHKNFLTPAFVGVAMMFEGWSIRSGGDVSEEEAHQVSANRMVHLHPSRVETRNGIAIMADGTSASIMRMRGEEPQAKAFDEMQGRIPGALRDLCTHFIFMRNKLVELHLI